MPLDESSAEPEDSPAKRQERRKREGTCLETLTKQHIRPLIELNDQINALTSEERTVNSTRIVVAGDQSHGKTSLLEALSGVDLPRGEGIQTRVPLILQLRDAKDGEEHALINLSSMDGDVEPERIGLGDVGDKVREFTAVAAGAGKDIRDDPIELKIFRRDQDDLTLVDLPGITRVALADQAGGDGRKLEKLILGMCKHYMQPEQSIILNVVSAMVDFSTSASLQLSRELDPRGERTMLCVTKVDQHQEDGLNDKINKAMDLMELNPEHIFAVRNRSQAENDDHLPLDEVRRIEMLDLDSLAREGNLRYGLGVAALSKQLVKIQHEQILQTLPQAREAIQDQISELEERQEEIGQPVGDSAACRAKAVQLIETCVNHFQDDVEGRAAHSLVEEITCEGASLEIPLVVDDLVSLLKKGSKEKNTSKCSRGFTFNLEVKRQGSDEDESPTIGAFLNVRSPSGIKVESMQLDVSISAKYGDDCIKNCSSSRDFADVIASRSGLGWKSFLSAAKVKATTSPVTFCANIFVEKLVCEYVPEEENSEDDDSEDEDSEDEAAYLDLDGDEDETDLLLCARLNNLQDELVSDVDSLYSNAYFFSGTFRKRLAREASACRGGVGLPGVISQHVPVNVLKTLRLKLPAAVSTYRSAVLKVCTDKAMEIVTQHVEHELYPKLNELMVKECSDIFQRQASSLEMKHDWILEWEESICSSNHYFMDTVQSIRMSISEEEEENKPPYLKHLTDSKIRAMSNEKQRLLDMQIEIFAYWKLMKKRLADYIIMSTYSELVNKPINTMLKTSLLEATLGRDDDKLVWTMSPNADIVRERSSLASRLERLYKARDSLNAHDNSVSLSLRVGGLGRNFIDLRREHVGSDDDSDSDYTTFTSLSDAE